MSSETPANPDGPGLVGDQGGAPGAGGGPGPVLGALTAAGAERSARRTIGSFTALVVVLVALVSLGTRLAFGVNVMAADPVVLSVATLAAIVVLGAVRKGVPYAERTLPWLVAAGIVAALADPYILQRTAPIAHGPALIGVLLVGPAEVVLLELATVLGLASRAGGAPSPYVAPQYLFASGTLCVVMLLTRGYIGVLHERSARLSRRAEALVRVSGDEVHVDREFPTTLAPAPLIEKVHPEDRPLVEGALRGLATGPGRRTTVVARVWDELRGWGPAELRLADLRGDPDVAGLVSVVRDVRGHAAERAELERRLDHLTTHDPLTGLPNRTMFRRHLVDVLVELEPGQLPSAVVLVDLDNFKLVNDTLGHDIGDRLIQVVAARLNETLNGRDWVCHFGGDEFLAHVAPRPTRVDVLELLDALLRAIREPVELDGHRVAATASVGLTFLRADHERPEQVIREADAALHAAKAKGRDRIAVYDESMQAALRRRHVLGQGLRLALQRGELSVEYQPKVALDDGRLLGFEALLRWRPTGGEPVSPADFVPVAEETGLIVPIGEWVLTAACRQLRAWQLLWPAHRRLRVAVNVSVHQLRTPTDSARYLSVVRDVLAETGIAPDQLELELTESAMVPDAGHFLGTLHSLRRMGVHLAVDDFGTGYSSLAYLCRFPVDILKIDRAFVSTLGTDPVSVEVVSFVVALAQAMGGSSVAEGIETAPQLDALRRLGAGAGQGYLFARPLTVAACSALLAQTAADEPPQSASA